MQALARTAPSLIAGVSTCFLAMTALHGVPVSAQVRRSYRVSSTAMAPTFLIGDLVLADSAFCEIPQPAPAFLELVVYRTPEDTSIVTIKRILGLPGDTLAMKADTLFRNGAPLQEDYVVLLSEQLQDDSALIESMTSLQLPLLVGHPRDYRPTRHTWGPLVIPERAVWVLGDNRNLSYDSRFIGPIAFTALIGRLQTIYWSWDTETNAKRPERIGLHPH